MNANRNNGGIRKLEISPRLLKEREDVSGKSKKRQPSNFKGYIEEGKTGKDFE